MNGVTLHVSLDSIFGGQAESGYGLIMADGKDAFLGVGKGFRVTFSSNSGTGRSWESVRWRKGGSRTASGLRDAA